MKCRGIKIESFSSERVCAREALLAYRTTHTQKSESFSFSFSCDEKQVKHKSLEFMVAC